MSERHEFKTEARGHVHAIARAASLAHEFGVERITVINSEGNRGMRLLRELAKTFPPGCLDILERTLPYPDYMKLLSSHRFIYQMDRSTVPGQVAGDCLLARTICAGGSSTIEKMAFSEFSDDGTIRMKNVFERIEQTFKAADKNGDGKLTADEIPATRHLLARLRL